jgi:hypothetical protein
MAQNEDRPVRDEGIAPLPRKVPYRAGRKQQGELSTRKEDLLNTGAIGHVPGHDYTLRGSSLRAGGVEEAWASKQAPIAPGGPRPDNGRRRHMPREIPVHTQTTHFGNITRYLDGHSEVHRDRPELVAYHNSLHPEDDADERAEVAAEIAHRDAIHMHKYW